MKIQECYIVIDNNLKDNDLACNQRTYNKLHEYEPKETIKIEKVFVEVEKEVNPLDVNRDGKIDINDFIELGKGLFKRRKR